MPIVTVNIRNVAFGGDGVGEVTEQSDGSDLLGITTFVPFTAAGEVISARVTERKKQYLRAKLIDILEPSSSRVTPECEYFENCGGCELQHLSYQGQLDAKFEMIKGSLRAAKFGLDTISKLKPVVQSEPYQYRRRITLHVNAAGHVGFYQANSRSVVSIESCAVANKEINEILPKLKLLGQSLLGRVSSILVETDEVGPVVILKSPYALTSTEINTILTAAKKHLKNVTLLACDKDVGGFGRKILELPLNRQKTLNLQVPAGSFSQVNWEVNLKLLEKVVEVANIKAGVRVLDLFSGAGNFSLPLARAGAEVVAVESDSRLVGFCRENANRCGLAKKLTTLESSVENYLQANKAKSFDVLLADPPRSGLGAMVRELPSAGQLIFISCQLSSFVRDLRMIQDRGWRLETIIPFDMFAQTSYIEILSSFVRNE
jgi:23S rRNA (uracil1939-C5)-methyltransferase